MAEKSNLQKLSTLGQSVWIDYLSRDLLQSGELARMLVLRFANGIFEPIWNRRYVSHVQMTVAEVEGIGSRGAYYDKVGALRDIVQNHMRVGSSTLPSAAMRNRVRCPSTSDVNAICFESGLHTG